MDGGATSDFKFLPGTVLATVPRSMLETATAVGMDVPRLMARADISEEALSDPDNRIPVRSYATLLRMCEREPQRGDLLAHTARRRDVSPFGVVGYVIRNAGTVGQGFAVYERHWSVVNPFCRFRLGVSGTAFSLRLHPLPPLSGNRLFNEKTAIAIHALICTLLGDAVRATDVEFPHGRHRGSPLVEKLLCARAVYDAESIALHYPPRIGRASILGADPMLFVILERYARAISARIVECSTWTTRTRSVLMEKLSPGKPARRQVARELAVSPRTLQRRLAAERTTFSKVLDEARRELALSYLEEQALPLAELSSRLGFADVSGFHRAFQRWTGVSPAAFRRRRC